MLGRDSYCNGGLSFNVEDCAAARAAHSGLHLNIPLALLGELVWLESARGVGISARFASHGPGLRLRSGLGEVVVLEVVVEWGLLVLHDDDAVVEFEEVGLGLVVGVEVSLIEGGGDGLLAAARLRARGGLLVRGLFRGQVVLVVLQFDFEAVFAGGRVQPGVVAQFDLGPLEVELVVGGRLLGRGLGSASQGKLVEGGVHLILVLREGRLGSG